MAGEKEWCAVCHDGDPHRRHYRNRVRVFEPWDRWFPGLGGMATMETPSEFRLNRVEEGGSRETFVRCAWM